MEGRTPDQKHESEHQPLAKGWCCQGVGPVWSFSWEVKPKIALESPRFGGSTAASKEGAGKLQVRHRPPSRSPRITKPPLPTGATAVALTRPIFPDFYRFVRSFLGDFNPQKLPSGGLQTLWEWKNRVLLEEYCIFNAENWDLPA